LGGEVVLEEQLELGAKCELVVAVDESAHQAQAAAEFA
jgi:hypothetical protein